MAPVPSTFRSHHAAPRAPHPTPPQVFLEDAGFDWKIMGPDVSNVDYVAWQCDQVRHRDQQWDQQRG